MVEDMLRAGRLWLLFLAVRIERGSRPILRELARTLLISIPTGQAKRGVHGKLHCCGLCGLDGH